MRMLVIRAVGENQRIVIGRIATQRGEGNFDAGLGVAADAAGIAALAEPVQPPYPIIRGEIGKFRRGIHVASLKFLPNSP